MAAAREQLEQLQKTTDDVEQTTQIARQKTVYQYLVNFWAAAITTARQSGPGVRLQYADSEYIVTAVDSAAIRIREGRIDKRYPLDSAVEQMPTELAMALCGSRLRSGDPQIMLYAGTFLAVDPNGSLRRARMLCGQAAHQGVDCEAVLPELKLDNLDSLAAVDRRELSALFAIAAPTVRNSAPQTAQAIDARSPIPSDAAQKNSLEKIRSIFGSDYAVAKSTDTPIALATRLFEQAEATPSDTAARWVLLSEARRLTTTAGDVPLLMSVVASQAKHYRVDLLKETSGALQQLPSKAQPLRSKSASKRRAAAGSIIRQILSTANEAITADEYEIASQLSRLAATVARKVKDNSLSRMAAACQKQVRELQRQWQAAEKARAALKKTRPTRRQTIGWAAICV